MVTVEGHQTYTRTDIDLRNWDSTSISTCDTSCIDTYIITRTNLWDSDLWYDSKLYKELVKKQIIEALKASWFIEKNVKCKYNNRLGVNVNRLKVGLNIRNTLPLKIRKD